MDGSAHIPSRVQIKQVKLVREVKKVPTATPVAKSKKSLEHFDSDAEELESESESDEQVAPEESEAEAEAEAGEQKVKPQLGKSRGFGFVQFREHIHALLTLQWIVNSPKSWKHLGIKVDPSNDPEGVPIIEFAIDKVNVLKRREESRQEERGRQQQQQLWPWWQQPGLRPQDRKETTGWRCSLQAPGRPPRGRKGAPSFQWTACPETNQK